MATLDPDAVTKVYRDGGEVSNNVKALDRGMAMVFHPTVG